MSFFGGEYGGPTRLDDDDPLSGDDGTYDPPLKWITFGAVCPALLLVIGVIVAWMGGIWLPGGTEYYDHGHWFHGATVVACADVALVGIATIMVARFLMPNIFRESYAYQYAAGAGIVLSFAGLICLIISCLLN